MTHLTPSEIVDAVDGALAPERQAHSRECARCRDVVSRAAEALRETRDAAGVDEPSPLFWDHFSERVRRTIEAGPAPAASAWWRSAPAGAAAAVLVAAVVWGVITPRERAVPLPGDARVAPATPSEVESGEDVQWMLVADAADDLAWDQAEEAGFSAQPGAAERAVLQLSDDQQRELARLLEAEVGRLKSRG